MFPFKSWGGFEFILKFGETDIREVKEQLLWNRQHGHSTIFLLGSGVSVSGGIPDGEGIIAHIRSEFSGVCARMHPVTYEDHLAVLTPVQRHELIRAYVQNSRVNSAHLYLASLVKHGYTHSIFTTNFDNLIPRALSLENIYPALSDFIVEPRTVQGTADEPAVVYLHGRSEGSLKVQDEAGYLAMQDRMRTHFSGIFENNTVDDVGYSGTEDPVLGFLSDIRSFENRLYWVGNGDADPDEHVIHGLLNKPSKHSCFVRGYDADQFFMALAGQLGLPAPRILNNPLDLVAEVLGDISQTERRIESTQPVVPIVSLPVIKANEPEPDIIAEVKETAEAEKVQEPEKKTEDETETIIESSSLAEFARDSWENEQWENAEALKNAYERSHSEEEKKYYAFYLFHWGQAMEKRADELPENAFEFLSEAILRYRESINAGNESSEVQMQLGNCLLKLASIQDSDDGESLFEEAFRIYEEILISDPKDCESLYNWGKGLIQMAGSKGEVEAQRLYFQAFDKFKYALRIQPEMADIQIAWGNGLRDIAATKREEECEIYLDEAFDKYRAALRIQPENPDIIVHWGIGLRMLARQKRSADAISLYEEACAKYNEALKIDENHQGALMNLALDLANLSMLKGIEEAKKLLKQSLEKYEILELNGATDEVVYNNWGIALWSAGNLKSGKEAQEIYRDSFDKFDAAVRINPMAAEVYTNKGICLGKVAYTADMSRVKELYKQADDCFRNAISIRPGLFEAYYNWGIALRNQAENLTSNRTEELFILALKQFEKAMKTKPEKHKLKTEWNPVFVNLTNTIYESEPEKLYHDTFVKYQQAIFTEQSSLDLYNNYDINLTMNKNDDANEFEKLYSEINH